MGVDVGVVRRTIAGCPCRNIWKIYLDQGKYEQALSCTQVLLGAWLFLWRGAWLVLVVWRGAWLVRESHLVLMLCVTL